MVGWSSGLESERGVWEVRGGQFALTSSHDVVSLGIGRGCWGYCYRVRSSSVCGWFRGMEEVRREEAG